MDKPSTSESTLTVDNYYLINSREEWKTISLPESQ